MLNPCLGSLTDLLKGLVCGECLAHSVDLENVAKLLHVHKVVDRGVVFYTCCHMDRVGHLRCDELGGHLKVVGVRDVIVHQAVDQTRLR